MRSLTVKKPSPFQLESLGYLLCLDYIVNQLQKKW